jgi:hypothetical protein
MSDELLDYLVAQVNEKINIPLLTEEQERALLRVILEVIFKFLLHWSQKSHEEQTEIPI